MKKLDKLTTAKIRMLLSKFGIIYDRVLQVTDIVVHPMYKDTDINIIQNQRNNNNDDNPVKILNPIFKIGKEISIREDILDDPELFKFCVEALSIISAVRRSIPRINNLRLKVDLSNYLFALVAGDLKNSSDYKNLTQILEKLQLPSDENYIQNLNSLKSAAEQYLELHKLVQEKQPLDDTEKEVYQQLSQMFTPDKAKHIVTALKEIPEVISEDLKWYQVIDKLITDEDIQRSKLSPEELQQLMQQLGQQVQFIEIEEDEENYAESILDSIGEGYSSYSNMMRGNTSGHREIDIQVKHRSVILPVLKVLKQIVGVNLKFKTLKHKYPIPVKSSILTDSVVNIILDTSASITHNQLKLFSSIIAKINNYTPVRVIQVDTEVKKIDTYNTLEFTRLKNVLVKGRGGTNFKCLENLPKKYKSKIWVFLTDGATVYPKQLPGYKYVFISNQFPLSKATVPSDYQVFKIVEIKNKIYVEADKRG